MEPNFVTHAKAAYRFLEDEYDFLVVASGEDTARPYYSGYLSYSNETTVVAIEIDRGLLAHPRIGRSKDRNGRRLISEVSLRLVREFFAAPHETRRLLTSHDPKNFRQGLLELDSLNLEPRSPDQFEPGTDIGNRIRAQLESDARSLEEYGGRFLVGDFSEWRELHEYRLRRAIAEQVAFAHRHGKSWSIEQIESKFRRIAEYVEELELESDTPDPLEQ